LAFAADPNFRKISARSSLIRPQLPPAIGTAAVHKSVPIYVANMAIPAGADETYWYNVSPAPIPVDKFPFDQQSAMN
jgi:hypothetical protein